MNIINYYYNKANRKTEKIITMKDEKKIENCKYKNYNREKH